MKIELENVDFLVSDFLRLYRNPEVQFAELKTIPTKLYQEHALIELKNNFRLISPTLIEAEFQHQPYHYIPTYRRLQTLFKTMRRKYTKCTFL